MIWFILINTLDISNRDRESGFLIIHLLCTYSISHWSVRWRKFRRLLTGDVDEKSSTCVSFRTSTWLRNSTSLLGCTVNVFTYCLTPSTDCFYIYVLYTITFLFFHFIVSVYLSLYLLSRLIPLQLRRWYDLWNLYVGLLESILV